MVNESLSRFCSILIQLYLVLSAMISQLLIIMVFEHVKDVKVFSK